MNATIIKNLTESEKKYGFIYVPLGKEVLFPSKDSFTICFENANFTVKINKKNRIKKIGLLRLLTANKAKKIGFSKTNEGNYEILLIK